MELQALALQIDSIPWADFEQPEWNTSQSVANALISASAASDAKSCSSAYDNVLYALGNNHAGTYYPVLLAALPVLDSMICSKAQWPQRVALCVLDDLVASFHPEPGYETMLFNGAKLSTANAFKAEICALAPLLQSIANEGGPNAALAKELASLVSENED